MKFFYEARNKDSQIKTGFVVAGSQGKAEQLLAENGYIIIQLRLQKENFFARFEFWQGRVSYKDLVIFSRQLSTLISARVPILQVLRILENQMTNRRLVTVIRDTIASVENGESLSLALSKNTQIFGNIYVSLVRAGEASGSVAKSLQYLADQLEKDYELRGKVKGAMTYPVFILVAMVVVGLLMFKFVLPKLVEVLKEQGGQLPFVSRVLISVTDFVGHFWWLIIVTIGCLILGIKYYVDTTPGRYQWDAIKIRLPLVGIMFQQIYLARFARNLATLVAGGIPIIQAIKIISDVVNNVVYRDILLDVAAKVTNGNSISDSLQGHNQEFPPLVTQMVKVGEQSAQLDDILNKLAAFYEREVDTKVQTLSSLLEPVIMIVLGVGVGFLIAGVLLPIYNLASTVG
jgi:type IV pilus assembly protein PilC